MGSIMQTEQVILYIYNIHICVIIINEKEDINVKETKEVNGRV